MATKPVPPIGAPADPITGTPAVPIPAAARPMPEATGPAPNPHPASVLYLCSLNSIRSPMAEGITKLLFPRMVVASAGVGAAQPDFFTRQVMEEIGVDLSAHRPHTLAEIDDRDFEAVVTLSPKAHHAALGTARRVPVAVEFWPTFDPASTEGTRDQVLDAYRMVRDGLMRKIKQRFGWTAGNG